MASRTPSPAAPSASNSSSPITLTIDVGGSGLKAMLLDAKGKPISERQRITTPAVPTVRAVLRGLDELVKLLPGFDRVSVGFPGIVKGGVTLLAVNLHPSWIGFHFESELKARWHKPVRVGNDADIQGYGAVKGKGVEMVVTLGTGMGSALFLNGHLLPNLELGHHPWKKKTYEDYLGRRGLDKFGKKAWNALLQQAIEQWLATFNWDHLYIGGGNTKKITFTLPENVTIVSNELGLLGGVALWREALHRDDHPPIRP
jgi:polyphosphate glucokinase